jgi:hypothetical protein
MRFRQEQRTLSILVTLGVLLGAGLALAAPFEERGSRRPGDTRSSASPVVTPSRFPSASPSVGDFTPDPSPTSGASHADAGSRGANVDDCPPAEPIPGSSGRPAMILRVIHLLAVNCGHAKGLQTAISHLVDAAGNEHAHPSTASAGSKGSGGSSGSSGQDESSRSTSGSDGSRGDRGNSEPAGAGRAVTRAVVGGDAAPGTANPRADPPAPRGSSRGGRPPGR